jgi:TRAP transporter 4TM/12TM fusion protein
MISGSAVANVSTSGPVTIPLMTDDGMDPAEAGAVEAVASTYGQLMPPILGASAFLMAEWLGLPYAEVALAALAPAVLAFLSLILWVDFSARARPKPPPRQEPERRSALDPATLALAVLPFAALAHALFIAGMAPGQAALVGCAVIAIVRLATAERAGLGAAARSLAAGAMASVPGIVGVLLLGASAALLMGLLNVSGAGFMVTVRLIDLAQGNFAILAAMTALLAIILGLGMPTAGVYLVAAGLCAPALAAAGADPLAAHLFILIFGLMSMITPPVALASYAAATLSGAGTWETGRIAFRMGAGMAIVGAAILIEPALLRPSADARFLTAFLAVTLALVAITAALVGHLARPLGPLARIAAAMLAALLLTVLALPDASPVQLVAIVATATFAAAFMRADPRTALPLGDATRDGRS